MATVRRTIAITATTATTAKGATGMDDQRLKLIIGQSQNNQSVVPVRWCVDKESATFLMERDAWVLIAIVHEKAGEVGRRLIPFNQLMEWVEFRRPGKHTLYATVVHGRRFNSDDYKKVRQELLGRSSSTSERFQRRLFDFDGPSDDGLDRKFYPAWAACNGLSYMGEFSIDIVVPGGFFAKERPAWLVKWAHLLWETPYVDDCDFRRHVIFSFTLQPILLPIILTINLVVGSITLLVKFVWATIGLSFGLRSCPDAGVDWSVVRTPFHGSLKDVWDCTFRPKWSNENEQGTWRYSGGAWTIYVPDTDRRRPWYWLLLTPIIWIGVTGVTWWYLAEGFSILTLLQVVGFVLLAMFGTFVLAWLGSSVIEKVFNALPEKWRLDGYRDTYDDLVKRRTEAAEERKEAERKAYLKSLTCEPIPFEVSLEALPKERRTLHLRYRELKAKVCRPRAI